MLYNKNRFKKVNAKKILHKVKKQWVTISIALLGLLGVKSVATHVNVNADVTSANNDQANHQLKSDQLQSGSSTLVQSNGASLTSASTNSASSVAAPSASVSASSNGTRASQGNRYQLNVSSAARVNSGSASLNVPSAAEKIHNDVLSGYAQKTQSDYAPANNLGLAKMVHHMLGEAPQATPKANVDNSIMGQLMDIMHNNIQSGANEKGAKNAYANLLNQFNNLSNVISSKPVSQWVSMLQNTDSYLHTIRNNGTDNPFLDKAVSKLDSINSSASMGAGVNRKYNLNQIATDFDTPGGLVHGLLSGLTSEANLDKIATGLRIMNQATTGTLNNDYNKIITNLKNLPNQSKAEQADTLSQLSDNIKDFTKHISNVPLSSNSSDKAAEQQLLNPSNPNGTIAALNNAGTVAQNEATKISNEINTNKGPKLPAKGNKKTSTKNQAKNNVGKTSKSTGKATGQSTKKVGQSTNQATNKKSTNTKPATNPSKTGKKASVNTNVISAVNSVLNDVNASTTFNNAVDIFTNSNFAKRSAFSNLMSSAETDLADNKSASGFIQSFDTALDTFGGATASAAKNSLNNLYSHHSADLNTAYNLASANASGSNGVDTLLSYMGGLNSGNAFAQLYDIHDAISNNSAFKGINSLSAIANDAATDANNLGANDANANAKADSTAYHNLLSNEEAPLFSDMVNRIVASGFNSGAFDNLVSSAETDLSQASNASDFIQSLTSQDGAFTGNTASMINHYLNSLASNSMLSSAYSEVSANPSAADNILNELSGMNSNNEVSELGDIAQSASSKFNDPTLFGSLAKDASNLATSVSNSQTATNTTNADESNAYQNFLKNNEASLFSAVVNRITASDFNSYSANAFNNLVHSVEGDLSNASTARAFAQSLSSQTGNFAGNLTQNIKSYMNSFANNPYVNSAYQAVSSDPTYTDDVLSNLSNMASNHSNEASDLNNIANDASSYFSNASSFGSLASDASNMYSSVSSAANTNKPATKGNNKGNQNKGGKQTPATNVTFSVAKFLNYITAPNFKPADFDKVIGNIPNNLPYDSSLPELWPDITSGEPQSYFADPLTQVISKFMKHPSQNLQNAYNIIYNNPQDNNVGSFLNDIQGIADHRNDRSNDKTSVNHYLDDVRNIVNGNNAVNHAIKAISKNSLTDVNTDINNFEYGNVAPIAPLVPLAFDRITAKGFDKADFQSAVNAVLSNISNNNTLTGLWNSIQSNNGVKHFVGNHGNLTHIITDLLNSNNSDINDLNRAYLLSHNSKPVSKILNDLLTISNHQYVSDKQVASIDDKNDVNNALNDIKSQVTTLSQGLLKNTNGMTTLLTNLNNVINAYKPSVKPATPSNQGHKSNNKGHTHNNTNKPISLSVPEFLNYITASNFNPTEFDKVINNIPNDIPYDNTLPMLWPDVTSSEPQSYFANPLTQAITKVMNHPSQGLQNAYSIIYNDPQDNSINSVLTNIKGIADYNTSDKKTSIDTYLGNIEDIINGKNAVNRAIKAINKNGVNDVNTDIYDFEHNITPGKSGNKQKPNNNHKHGNNTNPSVPSDVDLIAQLVQPAFNRIVAPDFDQSAFQSATDTVINEINGKNTPSTLANLWSDIQDNNGVKHFTHDNGNLTQEVTNLLTIAKPVNAAYKQIIDNPTAKGKAIDILEKLNDIASHPQIGNNEVNSQADVNDVDSDLSAINNDINDNSLKNITGMSSIGNAINMIENDYKPNSKKSRNNNSQEDTPHYADQNFNQVLGHLMNNYTMQNIADHLASNAFARSGEKSAFNNIINDLMNVPDNLDSQSGVNGVLSDIDSNLNGFHGPKSKDLAQMVQKMVNDVEAHDSTPNALAKYADGLGKNSAEGNLINDLNAGMQDVKSGQNNTDYQNVLNDLMDIDNHPKNEIHDLGSIAKIINKGGLKSIPLLKNVSRDAHQIAKHANENQRAIYKAAKAQQHKDTIRHDQIQADHIAQKKDGQRHAAYVNAKTKSSADQTHRENMGIVSEANSAARAAMIDYHEASMSASKAQKFAKGLNSGADSTAAGKAASSANDDISLAGIFESQAASYDQQARADVNNSQAVRHDEESAAEKAGTVNDELGSIETQFATASTDAEAAGKSTSSSTSSSSSSSTSSSSASSSVAPASSASSYVPPYTPASNSYVPSNSTVPTSQSFTPFSAQSTEPSSEPSSMSVTHRSAAPVTMVHTKDPNKLGIHQAMKSGKTTVERVAPMNYWFDVSKTCLAHNHIGSVGKIKDYSKVLHAGYLAQVVKAFKVTRGDHVAYRYEVKIDGHNYYVTANAQFTRRAYYQPRDLKKARRNGRRGHYYYNAVIVMPCLTHRNVRYTDGNAVRPVLKNEVVKIKKIIKIGRKGYGMTRFELTDGTFITSNRDFIKLL